MEEGAEVRKFITENENPLLRITKKSKTEMRKNFNCSDHRQKVVVASPMKEMPCGVDPAEQLILRPVLRKLKNPAVR